MDLHYKNYPCEDRLDRKDGDQTGTSESNNCTSKLKSPLYDADDSGYSELCMNGDLSDEHRFRKSRRSQNDDGCCETELWEPPFLGSSTPSYYDRSVQEQKSIQSPSKYDNGAEVLEIDLRRKHLDSGTHREGFIRSSPPLKASSSKLWYMDALLSSPNCRGWFGTYDATLSSKVPETNDKSDYCNETPPENKVIASITNEKSLRHSSNASSNMEKSIICKNLSCNENRDESYRIIEIGKVQNTAMTYGKLDQDSSFPIQEYREYTRNEQHNEMMSEVLKEVPRDTNNNDILSNVDLADKKLSPHKPSELRMVLRCGSDKDFTNGEQNLIKPYDLCPPTIGIKASQAEIEKRLDDDSNDIEQITREFNESYPQTEEMESDQFNLKTLDIDLESDKIYHPPLHCTTLSRDSDVEHDNSSDKDERQSDDTDTASDIDNTFKMATSSSKNDPVKPPIQVKRNKRKMYTPRKSADKSDPTFRGVTMWFKTEYKQGDTDLQISACYSNVKTGCSPVTYSICPSDQSIPDSYGCSEAEGHSPYNFIKMCASCRTRRTPLWRDAEDGTPLCNACGIRYKKYRLRCSKCWHIPKKEIQTYPNCPMCGASLRYSFHSRKTW